jgi:hypothetical protein
VLHGFVLDRLEIYLSLGLLSLKNVKKDFSIMLLPGFEGFEALRPGTEPELLNF